MNLRNLLKSHYSYKLGRGEISFRYDPWLNGKSVVDKFPTVNI